MNGLKKLLLPALAGVMALSLAIPAVAQDSTATPDASGASGSTDTTSMQGTGTSCDSSTILLAGLAQRYFGYTPSDVTLGNYAYGQYGPLFDTSTMMAPSMEATADMSMEATADTSGSTTGTTGEATADASGVSDNPTLAPSTVMLSPAVISGEDPSCTQLRTSLESFFSTRMQSGDWDANFRSGMSGMGSSTGASG
jgi:hypothetical protein